MSLITDRMILLTKQLVQDNCKRCGLPLREGQSKCQHCAHLSDEGLALFLQENNLSTKKKGGLVQFSIFSAILLLALFFLSKAM